MKDYIIQIVGTDVIRAQTRQSGDVEIVRSSKFSPVQVTPTIMTPGGIKDELLSLIPKSKRCELAQFLANA